MQSVTCKTLMFLVAVSLFLQCLRGNWLDWVAEGSTCIPKEHTQGDTSMSNCIHSLDGLSDLRDMLIEIIAYLSVKLNVLVMYVVTNISTFVVM